jgi:multiple sugar transport system substrate-binding protein
MTKITQTETTQAKATRRKFLKATGGMAAILATGRAPAFAQGTELHWLRWNDFVPACDTLIRTKLGPEAEKALGIKLKYETVNGNDLQPRITSGIQSGAGPDLIMLFNNHPHLYKDSLIDVSEIAEAVGKEQGGYYPVSTANCSSGGKFMAMPMALIGGLNAYRKSMFAEAGFNEYPKTWDQLREAGKKTKAKGYPIGQALGQSFGDPPGWAYPMMWSFGGREISKDGKTVTINSKETIEAVKFMTAMWKDSCDEGGLAWDDASNNRAFLAGTVSSTLNGASIYIESIRKPDQYKDAAGKPLKDDIAHAPLPAGPAGQFGMHLYSSHVVPKYTKNEKAVKELLKFIHTKANYEQWFSTGQGFYQPGTASWETHAMWDKDPVMKPFASIGPKASAVGADGEPNAKAAEVLSKYLIVNMFASAIKGQSAEEAVKAAETELKKIYA